MYVYSLLAKKANLQYMLLSTNNTPLIWLSQIEFVHTLAQQMHAQWIHGVWVETWIVAWKLKT